MIEHSRFLGTHFDTDRPRIADLTDAEQRLVWAFRTWAFAHQAARSVERDFVRICGRDEGERVAVAIRSILVLIALYGRRSLRLAPPGWPAVTTDEMRLLQLFAAAQAGVTQGMRAHLAWLLRPGHEAHPEIAVAYAAAVLARSGLALPWRRQAADRIAPRVPTTPATPQAERLRLCE